jgi:hypothetical protein
MTEHDPLALAPVLVIDLRTIVGCKSRNSSLSLKLLMSLVPLGVSLISDLEDDLEFNRHA